MFIEKGKETLGQLILGALMFVGMWLFFGEANEAWSVSWEECVLETEQQHAAEDLRALQRGRTSRRRLSRLSPEVHCFAARFVAPVFGAICAGLLFLVVYGLGPGGKERAEKLAERIG